MLAKLVCLIHTDAIKARLIPVELSSEQKGYIYASEADMPNVALFGVRAKQWRDSGPLKKGNIRDYASTIELAIISNIEFKNAELIEEKLPEQERLVILNAEANKEKDPFNRNSEKGTRLIKKASNALQI